MKRFCTECGAQIKPKAKFCHACGKSIDNIQENEGASTYSSAMPSQKLRMYKGEHIRSKEPRLKIKEPERGTNIENNYDKKRIDSVSKSKRKDRDSRHSNTPTKNGKNITRWILLYLILNLSLLAFMGADNNEILGSTVYSLVVAIILIIRRNRDNPVHWIIKIVLVFQWMLFAGFVIMFFQNPEMIIVLINLLVLMLINLRLIFYKND